MADTDINLWLGAWGATVSTWLAVLRIVEFRYSVGRRLQITASAIEPFDRLVIEIENVGGRPVTISSLQVGYGVEANQMKIVSELMDQLPKKLEEGDFWRSVVLREDLIKAAKEKNLVQGYFHRLWVVVRGTGGRRAYRAVRIEPTIIHGDRFERAIPFITADLFLGFSELPPQVSNRPSDKLGKIWAR